MYERWGLMDEMTIGYAKKNNKIGPVWKIISIFAIYINSQFANCEFES